MNTIDINKVTLFFQIAGVAFIIIGVIILCSFMLSSHDTDDIERLKSKNICSLGIIFGIIIICLSSNLPKTYAKAEANRQEQERLSYIVTKYYDVENMRLIKEENWSLFVHMGTSEYIEAVYIKDGKRVTEKFNTNTFYERIRIEQHDKNAVAVCENGENYLYISQEDYNNILGYK